MGRARALLLRLPRVSSPAAVAAAEIGLVLSVAAFFRSFRWLDIWPVMITDEATFREHALSSLDFYELGWDGVGVPNAFSDIQRFFINLMGDNLTALRLPAVLFGLASVVATYLFARQARFPAFAAALLLAVNVTNVIYSRLGLVNITPALFVPLVLLAFVEAVDTGRWWWWAVLGGTLALSQYFYMPNRILLFIPVAIVLVALVQPRWRQLRNWAVALLVFALVAFPLASSYLDQPALFTKRSRDVFVFSTNQLLSYENQPLDRSNVLGVLWQQTERQWDGLTRGDTFALWHGPFTDHATLVFAGVGIAMILARPRWPEVLVPAWLFAGFLSGGLLTVNQPFFPRLVLVTPAVALVAAKGLQPLERWQVLPLALIVYLNYDAYFGNPHP